MNEDLIKKCNCLVLEKSSEFSKDELEQFLKENDLLIRSQFIHSMAGDLYIRFVERILLRFGEMVDDSVLEQLMPLLDGDDNEPLFLAMNEHVDFLTLSENCFKEFRTTYLQ